jgi:nucleoside-diphosphate-sugar epimerase
MFGGTPDPYVIRESDPILVTGGTGFLGPRVVQSLLRRGFRNIKCLARPSSDVSRLAACARDFDGASVDVIRGTLLSASDCAAAAKDVAVILHLAAARGEKSFPDAFLNSVVTTRNLLEASLRQTILRRFVNVSSFTVYSNAQPAGCGTLDESCPVEDHPERRGDAYCFAKVKQDQLVTYYGNRFALPYVIVRPGYIYGPGNEAITGRVGIGSFGIFLHLGGSNTIPFTYVDNCADAVALAGLTKGIDGQVFNVVDDDLPSSRMFLRLYKKQVARFPSVYVPPLVSYALCGLWETYSSWSQGQLPPVFNRLSWRAYWKGTGYSNAKVKSGLGWAPAVTTTEGLQRYFASCREKERHA